MPASVAWIQLDGPPEYGDRLVQLAEGCERDPELFQRYAVRRAKRQIFPIVLDGRVVRALSEEGIRESAFRVDASWYHRQYLLELGDRLRPLFLHREGFADQVARR